MDFSKDQKALVAEWIDRQFERNRLFPCECAALSKGSPCVCTAHLQAYKSWSHTPRKRRHIRGWIAEWLNTEEISRLQAELTHRQSKSSKSGKSNP